MHSCTCREFCKMIVIIIISETQNTVFSLFPLPLLSSAACQMKFTSQQLGRCTRFHFSRRMRMMSMLNRNGSEHRIIYTLNEVFFCHKYVHEFSCRRSAPEYTQTVHTVRKNFPFRLRSMCCCCSAPNVSLNAKLYCDICTHSSLARLNFPCVSHSNAAASGHVWPHRDGIHTRHTRSHILLKLNLYNFAWEIIFEQ